MTYEFNEILEDIEKKLNEELPEFPDENWIFSSFDQNIKDIDCKNLESLIKPNHNLISLGGKRWRPLLMILCYLEESEKNEKSRFFKEDKCISPRLPYDKVLGLTPLVEFVHTASLIHDDIEDGADLRRGKPAAHISWGLDTALNSASYLYFQAANCIEKDGIPDELKLFLYRIYTKEVRKLHLGQAMDIKWHKDNCFIPEKKEYFTMVSCKTGTLASLATKIGSSTAGNTEERTEKLGEVASKIGIGFQIIDDVINLTTGNPGKKRGDDIVEGKKSLPVIIHLENNPADKEKISKYFIEAKTQGVSSPCVEKCIKLLESDNAINDACEIGKNLILENSKIFESKKIENLFRSIIPKQFL